MCVMPGAGASIVRSAWPISAVSSSAIRASDLPHVVAQVQPQVGGDLVVAAAPGAQLAAERADPLEQAALERGVDVLVVGAGPERAVARVAVEVVEGAEQPRPAPSSSSSPARCSTRACARDASRSYGASRQSKCTLIDSRASASAGPPANRPPHNRVGGGAPVAGSPTVSVPPIRPSCWSRWPRSGSASPTARRSPWPAAGRRCRRRRTSPGCSRRARRRCAGRSHRAAAVQHHPDVAGDVLPRPRRRKRRARA